MTVIEEKRTTGIAKARAWITAISSRFKIEQKKLTNGIKLWGDIELLLSTDLLRKVISRYHEKRGCKVGKETVPILVSGTCKIDKILGIDTGSQVGKGCGAHEGDRRVAGEK